MTFAIRDGQHKKNVKIIKREVGRMGIFLGVGKSP